MADAPDSASSANADLQQRLERMQQAALAHKGRRGKASMLQKVLDPGTRVREEGEVRSPTSSVDRSFSVDSGTGGGGGDVTTPRSSDGEAGRPGTAPDSPEGARRLMSRLQGMGVAFVVDGPQPAAPAAPPPPPPPPNAVAFPPPLPLPLAPGGSPADFIHKAPPPWAMVECRIRRDNTDKKFPKFELFFEATDQFLLSARKRRMNATSNYLLSTSPSDLDRRSPHFAGKLRANFLGTEFVIFDNGERQAPDTFKPRRTLGCVLYDRNILGANGPRKMRVAIPTANDDGTMVLWAGGEDSERSPFLEQFLAGRYHGMVPMRSVDPEWVPEKQTFVLDFNGRVKRSSVKNFQLREDGKPPILLQFGKLDADDFILDFQHPFTALQAFAIALSSFDSKLACE